ncbi:hypothetical protein CLV73_0995 [Chryseobacterium geocarposphaerae]|uniref:Lipocalin-like protein n=2 Tax=Chryseobacterium geocarposphaerae TaxID=1416776 RepID=A0A2M9C819_9FLAO|nr:hypothetical protein CLV73_0995 [Chryseobacterium geocarposphaerae]
MFKMKFFKLSLIVIAVLFLSSCKSRNILGSWEFIEVYEGIVINNIDALKTKENNSEKGMGILVFNDNQTFTSMDLKGNYQKTKNLLKLKYTIDKDTVLMKISYLDKNYLLISSISERPTSWFYRKIKN